MNERVIILCFCIPFLVNSVFNQFVHDDTPAIVRNKDVQGQTSIKDLLLNDYWGKPKNIKQAKPLSQDEYRKRTEQRIKDLVDKIREGSVIIEQLSEADQEAVNTYIKNLE